MTKNSPDAVETLSYAMSSSRVSNSDFDEHGRVVIDGETQV